MRRLLFQSVLASAFLAGCADPFPPLPPPEEVLVVSNRTDGSLSIIPVTAPSSATVLALGVTDAGPVAALGAIAVVISPSDAQLVVVTLEGPQVMRRIPLDPGSSPQAVTIIDDSIAYVASADLDAVLRVNYLSGATTELAVGLHPQGLVFTRGRLFVINGNLTPCGIPPTLCVAGESWITVVDPTLNQRAAGVDSIPLPGPGNARHADVAGDGLLYVMNVGMDGISARLSIVDPVSREEVASFGGFGTSPGPIAGDADRLFVSSRAQGLMEFDIRSRAVTRGEGDGVNVPDNSGVEVDSRGRIYAIEAGSCIGGEAGAARVLDENLVEIRAIPLGHCPADAAVTQFQRGE
ncbi:MAG: hypothetical protein HKM89_02705 [Gemmatimonadales bacterium]|nr:hypothetical protein [Gemmatimonadales bacterium]